MDNEIELRIIAIIDKIRPFLISDGGNLEFVKYEDNIVYVRLSGACKDCAMIDITLKDGIEEMIVNEIPEVKEVKNVDLDWYNKSRHQKKRMSTFLIQ